MENPIICAIDTKDIAIAQDLVRDIKPFIGAVKLGLEFFVSFGPMGIERISEEGVPIFLDLKFHDIPNTVAEAARAAVHLGAFMMTLHITGGRQMMQKTADIVKEEAAKIGTNPPLLMGITALTSLDQQDLEVMGVNRGLEEHVKSLADNAKNSGLDGIVCSPHEIEVVKSHCGGDFKVLTPGIRPASSDKGDQKRVMTPIEAVERGADYLVIGRPITQSDNPAKAAEEIANSLK